MRVENNTVILEREDCHWCKNRNTPQGVVPGKKWVECPKCKGTGKRGNGRCSNCNRPGGYFPDGRRPGFTSELDYDNLVTCPHCEGNYENFGEENICDNIPDGVIQSLEWKVIRNEIRHTSWMEHHIGVGLGSCIDYGRHVNMTDAELIEHEKQRQNHVQAIKVTRKEDMQLCEGIAIVTSDQGYSVIAYWKDDGYDLAEQTRQSILDSQA